MIFVPADFEHCSKCFTEVIVVKFFYVEDVLAE